MEYDNRAIANIVFYAQETILAGEILVVIHGNNVPHNNVQLFAQYASLARFYFSIRRTKQVTLYYFRAFTNIFNIVRIVGNPAFQVIVCMK